LTQLGLIAGIVAGVMWMSLPFTPAECAPVSSETEDFCNRLWTPALAGMLAGFVALFGLLRSMLSRLAVRALAGVVTGATLMFIGNATEYWFLNDLPHEGPEGWARSAAFMTLLLGFALVAIAGSIFGIATMRSASRLRSIGVPFVAFLPTTLALGAISMTAIGIALGALAVATAAVGLVLLRRHKVAASRAL